MIAQTNRIAPAHPLLCLRWHPTPLVSWWLTPRELGLRAIALTDHDTVDGVKEALAAGRNTAWKSCPALKFPPTTWTPAPTSWATWWTRTPLPCKRSSTGSSRERETRNQAIVDKLAADGYPISIPELKEKFPHTMLGRPHIGQLLVEKGCIGSVQEAMNRWLDDGKPYFVARRHLPMKGRHPAHPGRRRRGRQRHLWSTATTGTA